MKKNTFSFILIVGILALSFSFPCCSKRSQSTVIRPKPLPVITSTDVFFNSTDGYNSYRIPAIVMAPDSTLLAFVEGRVNSSEDFGNVKILVKKSRDNGKTWGASLLVAQNGNLQADNSTPVDDYTDPAYPNGRIFLFYCTGNNTQANVSNLIGVREVWYVTSIDNGQTWSSPINITLQVHHPYQPNFNPAYTDTLKWGAYATGPGHALQMTKGIHAGRIVVPINHGIYQKGNYATTFYTDDHGKTFHLAPDIPVLSDETTAAELPNGGVLLNSRNQYLPQHLRILSYDSTGNLNSNTHWVSSFNSYLIEPICEASMINYKNANELDVLLFSNPANSNSRTNLSVKQSLDNGKSWSNGFIIDYGASAYSDLVILPGQRIGVLYEENTNNTIRFSSFDYKNIPKQ